MEHKRYWKNGCFFASFQKIRGMLHISQRSDQTKNGILLAYLGWCYPVLTSQSAKAVTRSLELLIILHSAILIPKMPRSSSFRSTPHLASLMIWCDIECKFYSCII